MVNELLDMTDRWDASRPAFKVVKVKLGRDFFCYNDSADKPLIDKMNLSYDKYQLAKIISYQQLELLLRSFKHHPSFKDFVRWVRFLIIYAVAFVLLVIIFLAIIAPKLSDKMQIACLIVYVILTLILVATPFHLESKMKTAIKEFSKFCAGLNAQQAQFSVKLVKIKMKKINQQYVEVEIPEEQFPLHYQTFLFVESKKILQDSQYIKLYYNGGGDILELLCHSEEKPIYRASNFAFDQRRLTKFISFEELQLMLRPFKANYYNQKRIFWNRLSFLSLPFTFLILIPLLALKQDLILSILISIAIVIFIHSWFICCVCKSAKMNALMLHQFKEYCHKISLANPRIDIILHLTDTKEKENCFHTQNNFYCLQVRLKEHKQDIIT